MAKGKPVKKTQPVMRIAPSYGARIPTFYANFASVTSSHREIFIDFCLISPPQDIDAANPVVDAPVVVRMIAAPEFAQALKEALATHLIKAEERKKAAPKAK